MKVPLLDLTGQYSAFRDEALEAITSLCDSQKFILGEAVERFEKNIASYCGAKHAVGMSSGTDALIAALMALDVGPGDAVITTPYTFFATAGSIVRLGATPIFADIDPVTFNISPDGVNTAIKRLKQERKDLHAKVLMPVHLFGQCADMDPLMELAQEHGLKVVEDAAQAIGAEYPGKGGTKKAGAIGDIGCFSFFPSKNLGGFGDGGMVTTNDDALAERLRMLRNHGARDRYRHDMVGGNFRLDAIQAAVLDIKLKFLESWHEARRGNAGRYNLAFSESQVEAPRAVYAETGVKNYHIYNQYVVRIPKRDEVVKRLGKAEIGCAVYYPVSLHLQDCFANLGYGAGDMPESEKAAMESLALPIYPELTRDMQMTVIEELLSGTG